MKIEIIKANYQNELHAKDVLFLLSEYALDEMGGASPLPQYTQDNLIDNLKNAQNVFSVICYADGKPVGLVNCIDSFSTFVAKPLINIHDVVVLSSHRGMQLSQKMLAFVDDIAREKGCCKITLEVLSGNDVAKKAYNKAGFSGYELSPSAGHALFWQKKLD